MCWSCDTHPSPSLSFLVPILILPHLHPYPSSSPSLSFLIPILILPHPHPYPSSSPSLSLYTLVQSQYISPYQCPSPKVLTKNCSSCSGDDLCCDSVCTKGVLPPQPCNVVVANSYPSPLGAYVPRCSSDGNFAPIQCRGSTGYCWCVDISDGKPLSAAVPPGQQPNCTGMLIGVLYICLMYAHV